MGVGGWGRVITKPFRFVKIIDNAGWPLPRVHNYQSFKQNEKVLFMDGWPEESFAMKNIDS